MMEKWKKQSASDLIKVSVLMFFCVLLGCVSFLKAQEAVQSTVALIANKDVAESSLALKDVESIFLGNKTKWDNKDKITIYTMDVAEVHKNFLNDFVATTPAKFKSHWKKQVFTGKADEPAEFKSEKEMFDHVAKTKGAVGYVSVEFLAGNPEQVKQITVVK